MEAWLKGILAGKEDNNPRSVVRASAAAIAESTPPKSPAGHHGRSQYRLEEGKRQEVRIRQFERLFMWENHDAAERRTARSLADGTSAGGPYITSRASAPPALFRKQSVRHTHPLEVQLLAPCENDSAGRFRSSSRQRSRIVFVTSVAPAPCDFPPALGILPPEVRADGFPAKLGAGVQRRVDSPVVNRDLTESSFERTGSKTKPGLHCTRQRSMTARDARTVLGATQPAATKPTFTLKAKDAIWANRFRSPLSRLQMFEGSVRTSSKGEKRGRDSGGRTSGDRPEVLA